jgi:hypothetical protein
MSDPWIFEGDVRCWSFAFRWFIGYLFIFIFHKISSRSFELWLPEIDNFKQSIIDRLRQPAHPIEMEYYNDIGGNARPNEYIIDIESTDD